MANETEFERIMKHINDAKNYVKVFSVLDEMNERVKALEKQDDEN